MKLLNKLFILTATAIAISSCQGDLLDTKPYDKASSGSMWSNENFCTMGVASIYATLREGYVAKEAYLMEAFSVGATCRDNDYPLLVGTASIGSEYSQTIGNNIMQVSIVPMMPLYIYPTHR